MSGNIAETILEKALKKCKRAEVFFEDVETQSVVFEHNKLKSIETKQLTGAGLRVIKKGRLGFAAATDLRKPERLVEMALQTASFGQKAAFDFPGQPTITAAVKVFDPAAAQYPIMRAVERGRECIAAILAANEHFDCGVEITKTISRWRVLNSAGLDYCEEATNFALKVDVLMVMPGGGLLWVGEGRESHSVCDDAIALGREALRKHELGANLAEISTGAYPVLFLPKAVGVLFEAIEFGCNGKFVQKGISPLADKIGQRVADPALTIWDDPTLDYAPGCGTVDAEGTPCSRKPLIDKGVVSNFIFDLQTAGLMGVKATGNAGRPFSETPVPQYNSIVVEPGRRTTEELIRSMNRGIIVDQVLGAGQSNVLAGEFSVNIDIGFLVENGSIVGRVKNCMAAGNAFDVLKSVAEVGSQREWHDTMLAPAILLEGLHVAAKTRVE